MVECFVFLRPLGLRLAEVDSLKTAIADIGSRTTFNGTSLFAAVTVDFQTGANSGETTSITLTALAAAPDASDIDAVDTAITAVSTQRGVFGAAQNTLEHVVNSLSVAAENMAAAESRIRDLDVASEMVNFTKSQILQQAGVAILAQANQAPQSVLSLLR